jgi:hypothetical protein
VEVKEKGRGSEGSGGFYVGVRGGQKRRRNRCALRVGMKGGKVPGDSTQVEARKEVALMSFARVEEKMGKVQVRHIEP